MIDSTEGPGATLRNALWHHEDTKDHVSILYKDPNERGWEDFKSYKCLSGALGLPNNMCSLFL